ncbi:MATE efflux family protein [[Clostridium] sordellii]|uniref:Multidrug export protein MepA n=1 Tax=Paraclostridium sordellii TaxID=1505 RepID=A0ABM9RM35_PARSO|nr:MATE family efflux transporter [Paeniclostridium sordellii]CEJ73078.1 putative drug/sodium antiporter, MATE family [[Clostridium] sordellii] [Paeniclostridium sordellii]CEK30588.1 MATE efflux family protein [[Clostridium] sordellii] [Paeniclostridium sordellii]CEN68631.1 MATE efflux family protein [[Clostridium] sordellii] [Paeniclostridium sordellii]CEN71898.1 MATE efflux family protein [[Clostridium] sordellii] [Paeniclostridium sordellii]CEO22649.1 MATE efflux family protein [[Clostridiu
MENTQSNIKYLKDEPIKKAIAHLSIPMMIGMSAGTIYNVINAYFIGLVHDTAMLSAITLGLPIFTVLMAFGNMFGVGGGTFVTRLVAQNEVDRAKKVAGYTFYTSIIVGLLIAVFACLLMNPIVKLLGADSNTLNYTTQYSTTLFIGGFAVILNFALEQIVRSEGASKESMYGMFVSVVVSIILDILFILVLDLHVYGAALSMVIANVASSIYYIWYLNAKSENLKGFLYHFKISIKDQIEIYKIGVSELIQCAFLIVTTLLLNNFAMEYGDSVVASFGIALRIAQLPEFFTMGIVLGVMPLIAYNFSNKNISRLKEGIKYSSIFIISIAVVFAGIVYMFRGQVIQAFSDDPSVLSIGAYILVAMLVSALFNGMTTLFMTIYQASGEGMATGIMAISQGCLYIPMVIVLHYYFGLHGLVWSITITEVITCLIGVILYIPYSKKTMKGLSLS